MLQEAVFNFLGTKDTIILAMQFDKLCTKTYKITLIFIIEELATLEKYAAWTTK